MAQPLPRLEPMLVSTGDGSAKAVPVAVEPKWDGVRCLAYIGAGRSRFETRRGRSVTKQAPELDGLRDALNDRELVLDGELIALDPSGRPDFYGVMRRLGLSREEAIGWARRRSPLTYVVFDVLCLDGESLLLLRYDERRSILESLQLAGPAWRTTPSYRLDPDDVFDACCALGLEGVVTKTLDSTYRPGTRSRFWIKHKSHVWRDVHEHRRRPRFAQPFSATNVGLNRPRVEARTVPTPRKSAC